MDSPNFDVVIADKPVQVNESAQVDSNYSNESSSYFTGLNSAPATSHNLKKIWKTIQKKQRETNNRKGWCASKSFDLNNAADYARSLSRNSHLLSDQWMRDNRPFGDYLHVKDQDIHDSVDDQLPRNERLHLQEWKERQKKVLKQRIKNRNYLIDFIMKKLTDNKKQSNDILIVDGANNRPSIFDGSDESNRDRSVQCEISPYDDQSPVHNHNRSPAHNRKIHFSVRLPDLRKSGGLQL